MVKHISLLVLAAALSKAQGLSVNCSAPSVQEGQSITCSANQPVTWSLAAGSVGTLNNQTSTRVSFTAPASIIPQSAVYGIQTLPDDSIFTTRIDNLPLNSNSSSWTGLFSGGTNAYYAWGYTKADDSTPTGPIKQYYGNNLISNDFVLPTPVKRENGMYRSHWDTNDHHQIAVRYTDGTFWEIYNPLLSSVDMPPTETCQDGSTTGCNAASALAYPWYNYSIIGGTDAAALPLAGLTLQPSDVYNGLNHVTRFSTGTYIIDHNSSLWPAIGVGNGTGIPYGARMRLRICSGTTVTSNCVTLSSYSTLAQNILAGWHQYGLINADAQQGNSISFTAAAECQLDPNVVAAITSVGGIPAADFEVVDESSLQYSPGSLQTCPYNTTCNGTANTYEQPIHQAIIVATATAGGGAMSTSIALQGVSVGLNDPILYVMAGTPAYQIHSWVGGTSNQSVIWSLVSGVGSVTSGGIYTAPTSTAGGTSAVLKVVSAADINAIAYEYITIIPQGTNPTGSIRIDVGGGGLTDGNGHVWMADTWREATSGYVLLYGDYPGWTNDNATQNPEIGVYQSVAYTFGGDVTWRFIVPNGQYRIRFLYGREYDGAQFWMSTYAPQLAGRMNLETQGQVQLHNFNWGQNMPAGYKQIYGVPSDAYLPALVTDNTLEIAARGVYLSSDWSTYPYCSACFGFEMGGLEVIPDTATTPHWSIDTQQTTTISPGTTLQLYQQDWYTGLSDVTWSIASGPGTISTSGLYTAPTMQPSAGTAVTIMAQSASTPSISATARLLFSGTAVDIK